MNCHLYQDLQERQEGILSCMKVHYYTFGHFTHVGYMHLSRCDPDKVCFTSQVNQAWDGVGPWSASAVKARHQNRYSDSEDSDSS